MRKSLKLLIVAVLAGALAIWLSEQGQGTSIGWTFSAMFAAMGAFVAAGACVFCWVNED